MYLFLTIYGLQFLLLSWRLLLVSLFDVWPALNLAQPIFVSYAPSLVSSCERLHWLKVRICSEELGEAWAILQLQSLRLCFISFHYLFAWNLLEIFMQVDNAVWSSPHSPLFSRSHSIGLPFPPSWIFVCLFTVFSDTTEFSQGQLCGHGFESNHWSLLGSQWVHSWR